jgi:hypothetical protein
VVVVIGLAKEDIVNNYICSAWIEPGIHQFALIHPFISLMVWIADGTQRKINRTLYVVIIAQDAEN